jgi:hypothetical protein
MAIREKELLQAVQAHLQKDAHSPYVNELLGKELKGYDVYLWGGAVRDPLVNQLYNKDIHTTDFDLLVDDSKKEFPLSRLMAGLEGMVINSFGSPKWKPKPDIEIDIVPFSNAMMIRNKETEENSIGTMLKSCEFNTGAIAYLLNNPAIYSYGAIEAIRKKEVEIGYIKGASIAMLMSRLVLQPEKLGFTIGEKARKFIAERYSRALDQRIKAYLDYKQLGENYEHVVKSLRELQKKELSKSPESFRH